MTPATRRLTAAARAAWVEANALAASANAATEAAARAAWVEANARADAAGVAYDVRASYAGDHASPPLPPSPRV